MATDRDRLRARRLYVEGGKSPAAIAADIGVHRSTIYEWRAEGDWDLERRQLADKIRQVSDEATEPAVAAAAVAHRILSRQRGLAILAELAENGEVPPKDRIAAVKACADLDGWGAGGGDDDEGPPKRFVIKRGAGG